MKTKSLVSIIVPVYNGERYLKESLDSIVGQTYPNIEVLVMDDASKDRTPNIIALYGDKVTHFRNETNLGQFDNVNKGILKSNGKYVCVYHADDIYKPEIVAKEVEYLDTHESVGAVFCLDIFIDADGREYNKLELPKAIRGGGSFDYTAILNFLLTYKNVFLVGPTSMVRRSVYNDVGLYNGKEFRIAGDLEMWMRIAKSYDIGIIEEHLHYYRHDHGNLSQNYYHLRTETEIHFRIVQDHLDSGGYELVTCESLKAHQAHLMEDLLMVTVNCYILGELTECKKLLTQIRPAVLLGSSQIERYRLFILYLILSVLCRLPKINSIADIFYDHWYGEK